MIYSAKLLAHLEHPQNVGELAAPALVSEVVNSACGDRIRLSLLFKDQQIVDARMRAYGCPPTIAAASILTELIIGKTIREAGSLETSDLVGALEGLPRGKMHAADLAIEALQSILSTYLDIDKAGEIDERG